MNFVPTVETFTNMIISGNEFFGSNLTQQELDKVALISNIITAVVIILWLGTIIHAALKMKKSRRKNNNNDVLMIVLAVFVWPLYWIFWLFGLFKEQR